METTDKAITVENTIHAPIEAVWELWTSPKHITKWNNASEDWHTPYAENDLNEGGKFLYRMAAKDGSMEFDFNGTYDKVQKYKHIAYVIADGRKVAINFSDKGNETHVSETFDPESTHSHDMQRAGWQAILDNFKKYAEESVAQ